MTATLMNSTFPAGATPEPAQQLSVLEVFLPGISRLLGSVSEVLSGDLNMFAYLACAIGIFGFVQAYVHRFYATIKPYFSSTIYVRYSDEAYDMLFAWINKRGLNNSSRASLVKVSKDRKASDVVTKGKKHLVYRPWKGGFSFWYKGHMITYKSDIKEHMMRRAEEQIMLTCLGWSNNILRQLLNECRQEYLDKVRGKTTIFENRKESWKKLEEKSIRPLSTVILNQRDKTRLLGDIRAFLSEETRLWYNQRALPYRRGYLLYGPPGTGKSSLSLSLAGEFDLDIYVISIPDTTNAALKDLFEDLPETCVVLLEDIDAVGISRQVEPQESENSKDALASSTAKGGVTMSGLLNTLDGVTSHDGRIVIMTTNHREKLDEALIRPGRIDMQVEFPLADVEVITDLFFFLFGPPRKDSAIINDNIKGEEITKFQAEKFASIVLPSTFSQAEIISYLLLHKNNPGRALEQCQEWVHQKLDEKRAMAENRISNGK